MSLSSSLPWGAVKAKSITIIKGLQVRFMKGKVTADRTQLLAKPVMDGQGCEVKEICHCSLYSFHKHFLSAAIRGRHLSSGDLVSCTSWFYVLYKGTKHIHEKTWITQCLSTHS